MSKEFSLKEKEKIVKDLLLPKLTKCSIFTFEGPLGAGKTTLIKDFLKLCGVKTIVTSPTFAYMNKYRNKEGEIFYHFDLYRLNNFQEFIDTGFDEYLYQDGVVNLIEWPGVIDGLLKDKTLSFKVCKVKLMLSLEKNDIRKIILE